MFVEDLNPVCAICGHINTLSILQKFQEAVKRHALIRIWNNRFVDVFDITKMLQTANEILELREVEATRVVWVGFFEMGTEYILRTVDVGDVAQSLNASEIECLFVLIVVRTIKLLRHLVVPVIS
jgi:hypothetical protein